MKKIFFEVNGMKKRILALLLGVIMLFSLVSCDMDSLLSPAIPDENKGNTTDNNKQDNDEDDGEVIYGKNTSVTIIVGEMGVVDPFVLTEKIYQLTGKIAVINDDTMDVEGPEIILGGADREAADAATELLGDALADAVSDYEKNNKFSMLLEGFLVYSTGTSVALVWSDSEIAPVAFDYFLDKYVVNEKLSLEKGYSEFVSVDGVEQIVATHKSNQQSAWADLEATYGSEMVEAVESHLAMFDEDFYLWLAALYEKNAPDLSGNVLGGAFYYSNSARDNDAYNYTYKLLPDLESTSQVLTFLQKSGMLEGVAFTDVIPEEMRQQLIDFARALQSSTDGYFYHPQWGKDIGTSRRSRDCGWGATILTRLGSKPYWNTPSGTSGLYGAPGSSVSATAVTRPLSDSAPVTVSSIVLAAEAWTGAAELKTISAWENYLNSKMTEISSDSYSIGNTLSSMAAQIKNRDKLALKNGELVDADKDGFADNGYIKTFERILNSKQCANGLWESTVSYNSVNGLMKIAGGYSNLGLQIPNAEKALEAAVSIVVIENTPNEITSVYNPWVAINTLLNNITNYGDAAKSAELRATIKENAYEMLTTTTSHVAKFAKDDGSFGYTQNEVPYKSQGEIVAIRYTVEGDVNGGTIAFTGIWSSMCEVLEIGVLPFDFEDYLVFINAVDYKR